MARPPAPPKEPPPGGSPPLDRAAAVTDISREHANRIAGLLGPDGLPLYRTGAAQPPNAEWFGPQKPLQTVAPRDDVYGRAFDYPTGYNLSLQRRRDEPVSFETLRALSQNYDLLRLAIETRKDQMADLSGSVQPRKEAGEDFRAPSDDRCKQLATFFRKPDREHYFDQWLRLLLEEHLVIDAPVLVRRDDRRGNLWAAEVVAGDTIIRKLDITGRTPMPPDVAYQQILKGMPAVDYTTDELIYAPRNPRAHKAFGYSPTEQVIITVNIGIRRMTQQLYHFTDGNTPPALVGVPDDWPTEKIREFQNYWDSLMTSDLRTRRRMKFVPGQFAYQPTLDGERLMDQFDEWLARCICYAFSLPPLPFVKVMNRATAETSYDAALREGLGPLMKWAKNLIDDIIERWFGWPDLEWVWDDTRDLDPTEQVGVDRAEMERGIRSLDDLRAKRGQKPVGLPPIIFGLGPMGFLSVDQVRTMIESGANMPPPPMAMGPDGMPLGPEGMPMGPEGAEGDPLANAPPEVLAQLGIGPQQMGGPAGEEPPMDDEEEAPPGPAMQAGPMMPGGRPSFPVGNPRDLVRGLLRQVDRKLGARR